MTLTYKKQIVRPQVEKGVDWGNVRKVIAICGNRELWWIPGYKALVGRLTGYKYCSGKLVVQEKIKGVFHRVDTLVKTRFVESKHSAVLEKELLASVDQGIKAALLTEYSLHSVYKQRQTLELPTPPRLREELVQQTRYVFTIRLGNHIRQEVLELPSSYPPDLVQDHLDVWVEAQITSSFEVTEE